MRDAALRLTNSHLLCLRYIGPTALETLRGPKRSLLLSNVKKKKKVVGGAQTRAFQFRSHSSPHQQQLGHPG